MDVKTLVRLLGELADWQDGNPVRAVTPHGTYWFDVVSVEDDGDEVVLRLQEHTPS